MLAENISRRAQAPADSIIGNYVPTYSAREIYNANTSNQHIVSGGPQYVRAYIPSGSSARDVFYKQL